MTLHKVFALLLCLAPLLALAAWALDRLTSSAESRQADTAETPRFQGGFAEEPRREREMREAYVERRRSYVQKEIDALVREVEAG